MRHLSDDNELIVLFDLGPVSTEREQGNESRQNRDRAPRRYGDDAEKSSIILDGSQS